MEEMEQPPYGRTIFVCCNEREPGEAACANRGSRELREQLKQYVKEKGLKAKIRVTRSLCLDLCAQGKMKAVVDRVFPLAETADAHRYVEQRRNFGKVLLTP